MGSGSSVDGIERDEYGRPRDPHSVSALMYTLFEEDKQEEIRHRKARRRKEEREERAVVESQSKRSQSKTRKSAKSAKSTSPSSQSSLNAASTITDGSTNPTIQKCMKPAAVALSQVPTSSEALATKTSAVVTDKGSLQAPTTQKTVAIDVHKCDKLLTTNSSVDCSQALATSSSITSDIKIHEEVRALQMQLKRLHEHVKLNTIRKLDGLLARSRRREICSMIVGWRLFTIEATKHQPALVNTNSMDSQWSKEKYTNPIDSRALEAKLKLVQAADQEQAALVITPHSTTSDEDHGPEPKGHVQGKDTHCHTVA